jgi:hypothetical protein
VSVVYKTKIPTRIRFMIQDIIELKENNWVPRNARPKEQFNSTKTVQNTGKLANSQFIPLTTPAMLMVKSHFFSYSYSYLRLYRLY